MTTQPAAWTPIPPNGTDWSARFPFEAGVCLPQIARLADATVH